MTYLLTCLQFLLLTSVPIFREPEAPRPLILPNEQVLDLQDLATDGRALIGLFSNHSRAELRVWNGDNELVLSTAILPNTNQITAVFLTNDPVRQCAVASIQVQQIGQTTHDSILKPVRMTTFSLDGSQSVSETISGDSASKFEESPRFQQLRQALTEKGVYAPLWQPGIALPTLGPALEAMRSRPIALRDVGDMSFQTLGPSESGSIALIWNDLSLTGLGPDGPLVDHDDGAWWLRKQDDGYETVRLGKAIRECLTSIGASLNSRMLTISSKDGDLWISCLARRSDSTVPMMLRVSALSGSKPSARFVGAGLVARRL